METLQILNCRPFKGTDNLLKDEVEAGKALSLEIKKKKTKLQDFAKSLALFSFKESHKEQSKCPENRGSL